MESHSTSARRVMPVRALVLTAVFAALTAAGAYICIPVTPTLKFSLQMMFALMAGCFLGWKYGMLSQVVYLLLGLVGLPVFASGNGGFAYVLQPSFGFVLGFLPAAGVTGLIAHRGETVSVKRLILGCLAGWGMTYLVGMPYMTIILNVYMEKSMTAAQILMAGMLPYLPFDALKIVAAVALGRVLIPQTDKILKK